MVLRGDFIFYFEFDVTVSTHALIFGHIDGVLILYGRRGIRVFL